MVRILVGLAISVFMVPVSFAQQHYEGSFERGDERIRVFSSSEGEVISVNKDGDVKRYRDRTLQEIAEAEGGTSVRTAAQEAAREAIRDAQREAAAEARAG